MEVAAVIFAGLAFVTSAMAVVYTRSQARSAKRQTDLLEADQAEAAERRLSSELTYTIWRKVENDSFGTHGCIRAELSIINVGGHVARELTVSDIHPLVTWYTAGPSGEPVRLPARVIEAADLYPGTTRTIILDLSTTTNEASGNVVEFHVEWEDGRGHQHADVVLPWPRVK